MRRVFAGLVGLGLFLTLVTFIGSKFTLVAIGQATLPPGCYSDSMGLAVCGPDYVGPGGTPGPQTNLVAGTCIQITPTASPPSSKIISVNGSGCTPPPFPLSVALGGTGTAAPAPTSSNGCTITGTWPSQTFGCPTPAPATSPQVTPPITQTAGVIGLSIGPCFTVSAGALQLQTSAANCSPTSAAYDKLILSEASTTHFWPGTGSSCLADAIAGGATALPSPVPLTTPTPGSTPGPYPSCSAPSISGDGENAVQFATLASSGVPGGVGQDYLIIPSATLPASGTYTIEWVEKSSTPWYGSGSIAAIDFTIDGTDTGDLQSTVVDILQNSGYYGHKLFFGGSGSQGNIDLLGIGVPLDIAITEDGTLLKMYINCDLVGQHNQSTGVFNQGNPGAWGGSQNPSGGDVWGGRLAKLSVSNTAKSQTVLCTHTAALGL